MSILSREPVLVVVLLAIAGSMTGFLQDGQSTRRPERNSLRGHDNLVGSVIYAPDGRTLVTCGWDKQVRVWDVAEGQSSWGTEIQTLYHDWHVYSVVVTPDGKYLAASGVGGFAIWAHTPRNLWEKVREETGLAYRSLALSPDGHSLALVCSDRSIRLWDLASMEETRRLLGISDELRAVEFSPDGALIAASTFGGEFRVWDLRSADPQPIRGAVPEAVQSFVFLPGSRTLAIAQAGQGARALLLWDLDTGKPRMRFSDNVEGNNSLAISGDGKTLASADQDRRIRLWDPATGQLKGTIHDGVNWVRTLAFSPDSRRLAFGGQSGIVQFRDLDPEGRPWSPGEPERSGPILEDPPGSAGFFERIRGAKRRKP